MFTLTTLFLSSFYRKTAGQNTKRDSGRKVQLENIQSAKLIADVIRTCLGPRAMLKVSLVAFLLCLHPVQPAFMPNPNPNLLLTL